MWDVWVRIHHIMYVRRPPGVFYELITGGGAIRQELLFLSVWRRVFGYIIIDLARTVYTRLYHIYTNVCTHVHILRIGCITCTMLPNGFINHRRVFIIVPFWYIFLMCYIYSERTHSHHCRTSLRTTPSYPLRANILLKDLKTHWNKTCRFWVPEMFRNYIIGSKTSTGQSAIP